jgi:hypothetical protein
VAATTTAETYAQRVAWVKEAAGDRLESLEFQCMVFFCQIVPNRDEVLANAAPLFNVTPEDAGRMPIVLVGTTDQLAETLQERREEFGFSYWVVHEPEMEAFAPVVARLAGT